MSSISNQCHIHLLLLLQLQLVVFIASTWIDTSSGIEETETAAITQQNPSDFPTKLDENNNPNPAFEMTPKNQAGRANVQPEKKKGKAAAPQYQYRQWSLQINDVAEEEERQLRQLDVQLDESSGSSDSSDHELSIPSEQMPQRSGSTRGTGGSDGVASSIPKRRGESRVHSPSRSASGNNRYFIGDSLLGEHGLSGFFRPQMRNELDGYK